MKNFSKRFKEILKQKNLSISEVADLSDITRATIHKWINGEGLPSVKTLYLISNAIDVPIEDFFITENDIPPKTKKILYEILTLNQDDKALIMSVINLFKQKK